MTTIRKRQLKNRVVYDIQVKVNFDAIDKLKKKTVIVTANSHLREVMNEKGVHYKHFRYEYKINRGSLVNALAGKPVSLEYADSMAKILGVETKAVFDITETELYSAA